MLQILDEEIITLDHEALKLPLIMETCTVKIPNSSTRLAYGCGQAARPKLALVTYEFAEGIHTDRISKRHQAPR